MPVPFLGSQKIINIGYFIDMKGKFINFKFQLKTAMRIDRVRIVGC